MAEDLWLSDAEAIHLIRLRLGGSVGYSKEMLRKARASGEVQSILDRPVYLLAADDGVVGLSQIPGAHSAPAQPRCYNKDDLLDWLDRQVPPDKPVGAPKQRRRLKSASVERAIREIWGERGPTEETPDEIRTRIAAWHKENHLEPAVTDERVMQIVREKQKRKQ